MNKYLLLSAAALIATVTAGKAAQQVYCFTFASASGTPYCDGGVVHTGLGGGPFRSWTYLAKQCGGQDSSGIGLEGKSPGIGNVSLMTNNIATNYGGSSISEYFTLPKAFKNGKESQLWVDFSGATVFEGNSGELIDVSNCQHPAVTGGRESVQAKVDELIRIRRNAKALMHP